jgi:hypothetical protein
MAKSLQMKSDSNRKFLEFAGGSTHISRQRKKHWRTHACYDNKAKNPNYYLPIKGEIVQHAQRRKTIAIGAYFPHPYRRRPLQLFLSRPR